MYFDEVVQRSVVLHYKKKHLGVPIPPLPGLATLYFNIKLKITSGRQVRHKAGAQKLSPG
jgi:hypothetical protein